MLTSDMSAEERESMQNLLNALVVEVCADLHINLPFSVSLSPTADLVPAFQLSYAESMLLAPRASVYCDVFSITFSTRRTACELRAAFAHLQYLHRVSRSLSPRLVFLRELRRKMAHFVDAFEYYVQEEVLEPKFQRLFDVLAAGPQQRDCKDDTPFYDVVYNLHNRLMDKIFQQCFVGEPQIYTQLNAIFTACLSLSTFAQELDVDSLHHQDFERTTAAIRIKFERNLALLVRLLSHSKMGAADSRIPALLLRINFKNFKSF